MSKALCAFAIIFMSLTSYSADKEIGFDKKIVKSHIRANLANFKKCYSDEIKTNPNLEGKIFVVWSYNAEGVVTKAEIKSTTMNNKNVEDCVVATIKSIKFIGTKEGTLAEVQYPFIFKQDKLKQTSVETE